MQAFFLFFISLWSFPQHLPTWRSYCRNESALLGRPEARQKQEEPWFYVDQSVTLLITAHKSSDYSFNVYSIQKLRLENLHRADCKSFCVSEGVCVDGGFLFAFQTRCGCEWTAYCSRSKPDVFLRSCSSFLGPLLTQDVTTSLLFKAATCGWKSIHTSCICYNPKHQNKRIYLYVLRQIKITFHTRGGASGLQGARRYIGL